jgi:release factor glutamine methyltransferase
MTGPASSAQHLLKISRAPLPMRLIGKAMALGYRILGKHRYDNFRLERINGAPFVVTPSVFNPKVPRTGEFLASLLDANLIKRDWEVLDMGAGSGVCAIVAAKFARRVVAVDINPAAVRCTRVNALLNGVENAVDARQGDLFAAVPHERFELILFNPPFIRGAPRDDRDRAWRSSDIAERFAAGLRGSLKPGGVALVLLSNFGDAGHFLEEFSRQGLRIAEAAQRRFVNETLVVFKISTSDC